MNKIGARENESGAAPRIAGAGIGLERFFQTRPESALGLETSLCSIECALARLSKLGSLESTLT